MQTYQTEEEKVMRDVEKELAYMATYASPERREELLRFFKGQVERLLQAREEWLRENLPPFRKRDNERTDYNKGFDDGWAQYRKAVLSLINQKK